MYNPLFENDLSELQKNLIQSVKAPGIKDALSFQTLFEKNLMGICIPEASGGLGADFKTFAVVAAEIARQNVALAMSWILHVCPTILTGQVMDTLDIPESKRLGHNRRRSVHYKRILESKAVYAHTFSVDDGVEVGSSPFPTIAEPITGGWLVNGQKRLVNIKQDIDYYSVLCTEIENREEAVREKTVYLAVARHESGVSIETDAESQQSILSLKNVFVRERELLIPRGYYVEVEEQWPYMFLVFSPLYLGLAQAVCDCIGLRDEGLKVQKDLNALLKEAREAFYIGVQEEPTVDHQQAKIAYCSLVDVLENLLEVAKNIEESLSLEQKLKLEKLVDETKLIEQCLSWGKGFCS